jgi:beta-glucosidase/6-phospho-beta-glucosidase/beta-galactosidase
MMSDAYVYLERNLRALKCEIDEGAEVRNFHVWSCMDNFEWTDSQRHARARFQRELYNLLLLRN